MIAPIAGLNSAVEGIRREGERIGKDVQKIQQGFAAAQNAVAADSVSTGDSAVVVPAVEDAVRGAVLAPEGEITAALVDILQAKAAYQANIKAAKVTADVQSELVRVFKRDV